MARGLVTLPFNWDHEFSLLIRGVEGATDLPGGLKVLLGVNWLHQEDITISFNNKRYVPTRRRY